MAAAVQGMPFTVLLPSDYRTSGRSYPVLYLLHGAGGDRDSWLQGTDLESFTGQDAGDRGVIVVLPTSVGGGLNIDWRDGQFNGDTILTRELIPRIDASFCTLADRAHRAIAGVSLGGYSAMSVAARHPDLFAAAGSFSGVPLELTNPSLAYEAFWWALELAPIPPGSPTGQPWGTVGTDEVWFHNENMTELAPNFGGLSTFVAAGNDAPCDQNDLSYLANPPGTAYAQLELFAHRDGIDFADALARSGIERTTDFPSCGIHDFAAAQRYLHAFWPQLESVFAPDRASPSSFNYRRVNPDFSVWGWTFTADPKRAAEWLDIRNASPDGLTLTGSGTETVTTAPYFQPGATIRLSGAREATTAANPSGQITFTVDLGPPHPNQEYTAQAIAAGEGQPGYMTTRTVTIEARGERSRRHATKHR